MVFTVRGTTLPDRAVRTLVVEDGVLRTGDAVEGELLSDGGFIVPGLVDMHSHPGTESPQDSFDEELMRRHLIAQRDAGVLLVRAPGAAARLPRWIDDDPDLPRVQSAGRWLARPGAFYPDYGREVGDEEFVAAAIEETRAASGWCKVIGDWKPDEDPVPLPLLTEVVEAVHAVGGRVAVHCQTAPGCRNAVLAGADTLEHGMHLDHGLLDRMAAQGTALVPTMVEFEGVIGRMNKQRPSPFDPFLIAGWEGMPPTALAAHEAGVTVLAGTDCAPHGNIAAEIGWLLRSGLPPEVAVGAASWTARDFLGLRADFGDGASADMVVFEDDPVRNPGVLTHPKRIILKGRVIR